MAHPAEPMDVDSDFDNKENSHHHSNVLPCMEKGYEELDVSELNMKLRYSTTPASSPMSKSYTANCVDNRGFESGNVTVNENENLTRSLNSSLKNDNCIKSLKVLPLQSISTEQFNDSNRSATVLRPLDTTITPDNANITLTVNGPNDIDENLSLPSSSSSVVNTPEATTPTTEIPKSDGSPIMRGLKSVLNMFRSSQSPIPPENEGLVKQEVFSPIEVPTNPDSSKIVMASTPISAHHRRDRSPSKRNSPYKESIIFNEDLEKELQWKDETTILFSQERIPIHKLFFQQTQPTEAKSTINLTNEVHDAELDSTVEFMDISYNDSILRDKTMTGTHVGGNATETIIAGESDSEFVDCETTFTKNETHIIEDKKTPVNQTQDVTKNDSTSKLKPIILNTTQDILDATLSITPEDIYSEVIDSTRGLPHTSVNEIKDKHIVFEKLNETNVIEQVVRNEPEAIMHEQKIDQTFEKVSQIVNVESDNFNVTKSIENIPTGIEMANDPTTNNVDVTKTTVINFHVDCESLEKQSAPQYFEATYPTENKYEIFQDQEIPALTSESLDITHTVHNDNVESQICIDQAPHLALNKSIEMITAEDNNSTDHATVKYTEPTSIENNASGVKLEDQPVDLAGILNTTNEYIHSDNKKEDHSNIPVLENNNLITEREFAIEQVNMTKDITETANANNVITVEEICKPIRGQTNETPISLEDKPNEQPADIPLPDEDDIDNELNLTIENTAGNINTVLCNLPADLVGEIKIKTDNVDSTDVSPTTGREDTVVLPEVLQKNVTNIEDNDEIDHIAAKHTKDLQETNKVVKNTENALLPNLSEHLDIEILPNLRTEDEKMPSNELDRSKVFNETQTMEPAYNVTLPNKIHECKPVIDIPVPMDINESVCENKPLPDIINQMITYCQDNIEQAITGIKLVEHQSPVELDSIGDNIGNIIVGVPPTTEMPDVMDNMPQEAEVINVSENSETSNIPIVKKVTEEIYIVPKSDNTLFQDTIATMSLKIENEEFSEINKDDFPSDIATRASVSTSAQTNNVSPKSQNSLIDTAAVTVGNKVEDAKIIDEEVVASENNSPFVCVTAEPEMQTDNVNNEEGYLSKTRIVCTPPTSPPIASKGYNFNFDEMDDPFSNKTKIRVSPTLDTPNKCAEPEVAKDIERNVKKPAMTRKEVNNRRKSQPGRKRPPAHNMKLNSTFNTVSDKRFVDKPAEATEVAPIAKEFEEIKSITITTAFDKEDKEVQDIIKTANKNIEQKFQEALKFNKEMKCIIDEKLVGATSVIEKTSVDSMIEVKNTSSSEQSTYFSAGTSSSESIKSKNIFNLPEIDDMNFNPFASKSKMRQSPPLIQDIDNPFDTRSKIMSSPDIPPNGVKINTNEAKPISDDKMETELMEKDTSTNISNTTTSSKGTDDKDITIREVNTEDEDTAEGPFFEVEDLNNVVKMTDFDTENDMMQFNVVPPQTGAENQDNDELFIDAEAFEFLLNQNKSNTVVDSGKESLFLKFDPLFANRMSSDGILAALTQLQKRQSTPTKLTKHPQTEPISPIAGPSNLNITHNVDTNPSENLNEDHNITVSKPMMVVPPAINPITPKNKPVTPTRPNRRSVTFTSPAMAVIDRLLSLSANNSPIYDNTFHVSREQTEADLALTQLRELLAEKEIHVYNLRTESQELKDRLSTMESQVRTLEAESQTRLKKITDLNETLVEKTKLNKSMALVVEEYERTIASLISEIEQDKKRNTEEKMKLINERDEQTAHLASMEVSFSDLHSKYEKSKQVIFSCKANEDAYKKSLKEFEENVTKMQNNFDLLKQHATSKLNHANQELEKMNKAHEAEVLKLNAMIKRKDLHITSLEETMAQKTKANEELTAICDELINKVG